MIEEAPVEIGTFLIRHCNRCLFLFFIGKEKLWDGRGASSENTSKARKLISNNNLANMTWAQVKKANTDFFNKHSHYDGMGKQNNKYTTTNGYVDNGFGGAIKKEYKDMIITKSEWEKAKRKSR